jgi:hypothetical protein
MSWTACSIALEVLKHASGETLEIVIRIVEVYRSSVSIRGSVKRPSEPSTYVTIVCCAPLAFRCAAVLGLNALKQSCRVERQAPIMGAGCHSRKNFSARACVGRRRLPTLYALRKTSLGELRDRPQRTDRGLDKKGPPTSGGPGVGLI